MSVYHRADSGAWQVKVYAGVDPLSGKRRFLYAAANTQKEARRLERELLEEAETCKAQGDETLGHHFETWLELDIKPRRAANTYRAYSKGVDELRRSPRLWHTPLREVTKATMRRWAQQLDERSISDSWKHSLFMYVSAGFEQARKDDKISVNPLEGVPRPTKPEPRQRRYDADVFEAILELAWEEDSLASRGLIVQFFTGCREGEILNLTLPALHLDDPEGPWLEFGLETAKTPAGRRAVELEPPAVQALRDVLAVHADWQGAWGWDEQEHDWLFRDLGTGRRLQDGRLGKCLRRLKADLGITMQLSTHDFRHYFATRAAAAHVNPAVLKHWLGHKSETTTMRYYQHPTREGMAELRRRMFGTTKAREGTG